MRLIAFLLLYRQGGILNSYIFGRGAVVARKDGGSLRQRGGRTYWLHFCNDSYGEVVPVGGGTLRAKASQKILGCTPPFFGQKSDHLAFLNVMDRAAIKQRTHRYLQLSSIVWH